jgi:mannose-1-phosphate guanylyltransferase
VLRVAARRAASGEDLATIGVPPTRPETGYGYIKRGKAIETAGPHTLYQVDRFVEKPTEARARHLLSSGAHFWNSGMFVCRADTMLGMIREHLPKVAGGLERIGRAMGSRRYQRVLRQEYATFPSISIDYGVAEREKRVVVIPADLGWSDMGSWRALMEVCERTENGNVVAGRHISIDSRCSVIHSPRKLIATIGIRNLVIVDTEDALLICSADRAQDVREVVDQLDKRGLTKYL